jgi:maltokinase
MTAAVDRPAIGGERGRAIMEALRRWLPTRRWFGVAGRVTAVEPVHMVAFGGRADPGTGVLMVVAARVRDADGEQVVHYQIPLGLRAGNLPAELAVDLITRVGDRSVYDATADPSLMADLLNLILAGRPAGPFEFSTEPAPAGGAPAAAGRPPPDRPAVRRLSGEQSNTSVVFADRFILKLFRRLMVGVNPELEIHRAIRGGTGMPIPDLVGAVETRLDDAPVTLGVLHRFAAGAVDGWQLATSTLARPGDPPVDLGPDLRRLGVAVARTHDRLAAAFGTTPLTEPLAARLRLRLHRRLDQAARAAPVLVPDLPRLHEVIEHSAQEGAAGGAGGRTEWLQRVHGDLHLGQALRTRDGWLLIDFEGEPAAPIRDRVTPNSPLVDLAGMLRSIDYAAGYAVHVGALEIGGADRWATAARAVFTAGYVAGTGVPLAGRSALLRAYELDKAVYEVVYETRNRPDWIGIPLAAVRRFTRDRSR